MEVFTIGTVISSRRDQHSGSGDRGQARRFDNRRSGDDYRGGSYAGNYNNRNNSGGNGGGYNESFNSPPNFQSPPNQLAGGRSSWGSYDPSPNRSFTDHRSQNQSALLQQFIGGQVPNLRLTDLTGHVAEFAQNTHGSRFIQEQLGYCSAEERDFVFNEVSQAATILMTNACGNFIVQKYFEVGELNQQMILLNAMSGNIRELATNKYGTYVLIKAMDTLDPSYLTEISAAIGDDVYGLCTHFSASQVIHKVLERCNKEQKRPILKGIFCHLADLAVDKFGNYVVQQLVQNVRANDVRKIVAKFKGRVAEFCKHKFASNVVEKVIFHGTEEDREAILEEVLANDDTLYSMIEDQYGNYVIAKMLKWLEGKQRNALVSRLQTFRHTMTNLPYDRRDILQHLPTRDDYW